MKYFNRLANREFLILVAVAASALTLQVREHVADAQPTYAPHAIDERLCEPSASNEDEAPRMLPADCGIRADMRTHRARARWV
ncbi:MULTISPECIES: hypothetical protein [Caballeronia]|uniref:Secreted protein n=1 Tax=Caballeronia cordobensis TaxID=1353886 RepID=A0A158FC40_CABCO|nr:MULTISPECIES: hypothetical protein [Caballeronia]BAO85807.1 uncharacterized protein BRPE67_ACDS07520 [Burkholderia sp. RPE67]BBP95639.1 hypothetical protein BSFA1_07680 [Burkholderia sp. SFA1]MCE4542462.1 hypothetical protein [Caballeronia sp. PC1]MCE4568483.1 hypothetical protein [Caballeronia sp. CLC5]SAL17466.1 hypothetical protein AWB70_00738 [Caballeronia cordobensis]